MNYKLQLLIILVLMSALLGGCEWLKATQEAALTPEAQKLASGLVTNIMSGNWSGAIYNVGEFLTLGYGVYKATMITRDGKRKKRGEPVSVVAPAKIAKAKR